MSWVTFIKENIMDGGPMFLKDWEIMTRLGFEFEGHILVVLGCNFAPEPPGFLRDAFSPLLIGQSLLILFFAVSSESYLTHNAFKKLLYVVLNSRRCLNEFTVKHNGAGSAFCNRLGEHTWTYYLEDLRCVKNVNKQQVYERFLARKVNDSTPMKESSTPILSLKDGISYSNFVKPM